MRHVSRTQRVALDWLFDRINLDPKIQIKYDDTKKPLADLLTQGNFTRDEWNQFFDVILQQFQSNQQVQDHVEEAARRKTGEDRVVAKSKAMMSLVSKNANRSPTLDSGASNSPVTLEMQCQSSYRSGTGKPVAKMLHRLSETRLTHHNFEIFNVNHLEKVFSNVRQKLNRPERDEMKDVQGNGMIWGIFMSATMTAAVHLGADFEERLRTSLNTDFEQAKTLFNISQSLIPITKVKFCCVSTIEWNTTPWISSTLLHGEAIKLSRAKVQVYSDSVLCLGKIHEHSTSIQKWKEQIGWFMDSEDYQELKGIDGEAAEFEWNIFQGHSLGTAPRDSDKKWQKTIKPENFRNRITFMSCGRPRLRKQIPEGTLVFSRSRK